MPFGNITSDIRGTRTDARDIFGSSCEQKVAQDEQHDSKHGLPVADCAALVRGSCFVGSRCG